MMVLFQFKASKDKIVSQNVLYWVNNLMIQPKFNKKKKRMLLNLEIKNSVPHLLMDKKI